MNFFQDTIYHQGAMTFSVEYHDTYPEALIIGSTKEQAGILHARITQFPGSNTILISSGLWVYPGARGKGYSKLYQAFLENFAKDRQATAVVASVKRSNMVQTTRLSKLGWQRLSNAIWMWKP